MPYIKHNIVGLEEKEAISSKRWKRCYLVDALKKMLSCRCIEKHAISLRSGEHAISEIFFFRQNLSWQLCIIF